MEINNYGADVSLEGLAAEINSYGVVIMLVTLMVAALVWKAFDMYLMAELKRIEKKRCRRARSQTFWRLTIEKHK